MKPFWVAFAYSVRAGFHKKSVANCGHRHRTRGGAYDCCEVMRRTRHSPTRIGWRWSPGEIVFVRSAPGEGPL